MNAGNMKQIRENTVPDRLTAVSFAVDDLRLYLDTHPGDEDALRLIGDYLTERKKMLSENTSFYGSAEAYDPNLTNGWDWNAGPMPWKG